MHQLNEDAQLLLFDNCCLWLWIREKMVATFPGAVIEQHDKLFEQGFPGLNISKWGEVMGITLKTCHAKYLWLNILKHDWLPNIFG